MNLVALAASPRQASRTSVDGKEEDRREAEDENSRGKDAPGWEAGRKVRTVRRRG